MKQHSDLWHTCRADLAQRGTAAHAHHQLGNRPETAMKDKTAIDQLRQQFRRLQGSVNYWNNAARAAQRGADNHTGQRKEDDLKRLAEFNKKAIAAQQQLDQVKNQLTELDPKGARARQLNALRSAIARANREIQHCQHLANLPGQSSEAKEHWQARLTRRQAKLQQLLDGLANHNTKLNRLAQQKRDQAELIAVADRAYSYDPLDPAELEALAARHRGLH
mgnify:CR=1 FL=1